MPKYDQMFILETEVSEKLIIILLKHKFKNKIHFTEKKQNSQIELSNHC